jgi:hypothetical protein
MATTMAERHRRDCAASARRGMRTMALLLLTLGRAGWARAGDEQELREAAQAAGRVTLQERPFGFLSDPSTPSAGVGTLAYSFGLGSGIAADRPIPVNLVASNGSHSFTLAYGLTHRLAPFASATVSESTGSTATIDSTVSAGVTYQVTRPGAPLRVSISGAGVHEGTTSASGLSAVAAASLEQGPLRVAANVRADRMFAANRDAVDVITMLGASYRLATALRVGAEYVGQDLEEMLGDDAEGGARHALGPNVALDLDGGRYQIVLASAFGLTPKSPRALARVALALAF